MGGTVCLTDGCSQTATNLCDRIWNVRRKTSILSSLQSSNTGLFSSLSRVGVQRCKVLPVRTLSFERGTVGGRVKRLLHTLSSNIQQSVNRDAVTNAINQASEAVAVSKSTRGVVAKTLACQFAFAHCSVMFMHDFSRRRGNAGCSICIVCWLC